MTERLFDLLAVSSMQRFFKPVRFVQIKNREKKMLLAVKSSLHICTFA